MTSGESGSSSVLTAFYVGSVALMISSFTGRKAVAVAVIIIGFIVVSLVCRDHDCRLSTMRTMLPYLALISPLQLVTELSFGIVRPACARYRIWRSDVRLGICRSHAGDRCVLLWSDVLALCPV